LDANLTKDSLAVAIEALSWMAYANLGERSALFKAAEQLGVSKTSELRQAHRLVMETTRFQNRLEYLISQVMAQDEIKRAPHGISSFLKMLAYLKYVDGASQKNLAKTVSWARQALGWRELHPYEERIALIVSGSIPIRVDALPEFEKLSFETCHPSWFVERLVRLFGRNRALQMLRRNLQPVPAYARLNSLKVTDEAEKLRIAKGLGGSKIEGVENVLRLGKPTRALHQSDLFASGAIVVQDLASITAGLVASPKLGQTVFDICSAPGNKTTHLAEQMQNKGVIYSIDISDQRLMYWTKEINRTGCSIAMPIRADGRRIPLQHEADVLLLDPPCSNTGVFARNPAIKWKTTSARVNEFSLKQYAMLQAASEHVGPNGTLVYCTCSILPEENEYVLEAFLRQNPNFKVVPQTPFLGSPGLRGFDRCQRFYTHLHECNGYFIAKLQRTD
jgi:16S rRNA (cytosine967-C5)-methyltransferase